VEFARKEKNNKFTCTGTKESFFCDCVVFVFNFHLLALQFAVDPQSHRFQRGREENVSHFLIISVHSAV